LLTAEVASLRQQLCHQATRSGTILCHRQVDWKILVLYLADPFDL